jgi:BRCA1-associated protein
MQVCNHKFHNECLQQWGDSSCPVCRYSVHSSHNTSCAICATTSNLWMCLICGHVGCGRYNLAHARDHYTATNHCYSLEVQTGRVRPFWVQVQACTYPGIVALPSMSSFQRW